MWICLTDGLFTVWNDALVVGFFVFAVNSCTKSFISMALLFDIAFDKIRENVTVCCKQENFYG